MFSPCVLVVVLEVSPQARLAGRAQRSLALEFGRQLLLDDHSDRCPWPGSIGPTACSSGPSSDGWRRCAERDDGLHRPLPNERVPITVARLWSCSAPATISDAEAEPPLMSTTTCLPSVMSPGRALARCVSSWPRPLVSTMAPLEEVVGDGDRLVEQAARIVAQIDDVALEVLPIGFFRASTASPGWRASAR